MQHLYTEQDIIKKLYQNNGILSLSQANKLGIKPYQIYSLRDKGKLIAVSRGLYRLANIDITENYDGVIYDNDLFNKILGL